MLLYVYISIYLYIYSYASFSIPALLTPHKNAQFLKISVKFKSNNIL